MITAYTQKDYAKSYTELIEILKYFPKSDLAKIPKNIILKYIKYRDTNYTFSYNPNLNLKSQNVSKLAQILVANLYIDYFTTKNENENIKNEDYQELLKLEKQMQEKYNINNIFKKRI